MVHIFTCIISIDMIFAHLQLVTVQYRLLDKEGIPLDSLFRDVILSMCMTAKNNRTLMLSIEAWHHIKSILL